MTVTIRYLQYVDTGCHHVLGGLQQGTSTWPRRLNFDVRLRDFAERVRAQAGVLSCDRAMKSPREIMKAASAHDKGNQLRIGRTHNEPWDKTCAERIRAPMTEEQVGRRGDGHEAWRARARQLPP